MKAVRIQERWRVEKFVTTYNRLADQRSGWYYDGELREAELERRYRASPQRYPELEHFAEGVFLWDQVYDL